MDTRATVIMIDCPWAYNQRSLNVSRPTKFGSGAMGHYPVMTDQELIDFKVEIDKAATKNTVMFSWATGARLDFAIELMKAWDFKYSTVAFVWNKLNPKSLTPVTTPGYYTSSSCEFVIIGARTATGKIHKPALFPVPQYIEAARREHSRKPEEVRKAIEQMYPHHDKVEFFARETTPGWSCYGNETTKFNQVITIRDLQERIGAVSQVVTMDGNTSFIMPDGTIWACENEWFNDKELMNNWLDENIPRRVASELQSK